LATIVFFHAHPDDEAIGSGGSMAKASALGHRVVLVVATKGEHGTRPEGIVGPDEDLADRRVAETVESARILGVHRLEFLGYRDSGMMGDAGNDDPGCFWAAEVESAAQRLADLVAGEKPDVLVIYDETGVTGHPDHIQVHRVGMRAAELAGVGQVLQGTLSRSQAQGLVRHAMSQGGSQASVDVDLGEFGTPDELVEKIDVRDYLDRKRQAMAAHASQISETSIFLSMPPDLFETVWGHESLLLRNEPNARVNRLFETSEGRELE
jgi:LmbE family N-acetylglucosaminyl deacetylase